MDRSRLGRVVLSLALAAAPVSLAAAEPIPGGPDVVEPAPADAGPPRLVVVLSIDQLRGDYLPRFLPHLGAGGFRRVLREGFSYRDCRYASANTETGPGHASLLTGAYARGSGIVQNDWFDAKEGREVYCVADDAVKALTPAGARAGGGRSPRRLLAATVGDALEVATNGASKTLSVSLKDRAAILMGGHAADLALWFDPASGDFVSSTWYGDRLPGWVVRLDGPDGDAPRLVDRWFRTAWTPSLPDAAYARCCTSDDYRGESAGPFETNAFPHVLGGNSEGDGPDRRYYECLFASPFGNDLLVDLVARALPDMGLGKDDVPDLLTIGFSANDPIGHAFGPDSWEVMDATIKTDATLARLLDLLDHEVGAGRWTIFVTADHGVADLPEVREDHHLPSGRVSPKALTAGLERHLAKRFGPALGKGRYVASLDRPWVTLAPDAIPFDDPGLRARLADAAARWLADQPGVLWAIPTRALDRASASAPDAPLLRALRLCVYPGRSGDVALVLEPGYLLAEGRVGTTHGTPHRYDQMVPLLAMGRGIRHGTSARPVEPPQIAPTVAALLGLVPPDLSEVLPLDEALGP